MKKLVSMLLVLCLVLCSVTMVALADDSDTVTYEITDENMALLERFKSDPSSVSFDELSQAMNEDIVFAAEAYKVLDSISATVGESYDCTVDGSFMKNLPDDTNVSSGQYQMHDFETSDTQSVTLADVREFGSDAITSYSVRDSSLDFTNWQEGICKIFARSDSGFYFAGSGSRVSPDWVLTCAHITYQYEDVEGIMFEGDPDKERKVITWWNHTYASEIVVIPAYVGELPDTEYNVVSGKPTLTVNNSPRGSASAVIKASYISPAYTELTALDSYNDAKCVSADWAMLYVPNDFDSTHYFNLQSMDDMIASHFDDKFYSMMGYPGAGDKVLTQKLCKYTGLEEPGMGCFNELPDFGMSGGPLLDGMRVSGVISRQNDKKGTDKLGLCCLITGELELFLRDLGMLSD